MQARIIVLLLPLVHSDASILGFGHYRHGRGYNYGYGYNPLYSRIHHTGYNQLYDSVPNLGYNPGYNYPTEDLDQGTNLQQPAFRAVPAVPVTAAQEKSLLLPEPLPEPIFTAQSHIVKSSVPDFTRASGDVLAVGDHLEGDVLAVGDNLEGDVLVASHEPEGIIQVGGEGPVGVPSEQFHAQDEFGNHEYGYSNLNSAKHEVGVVGGGVRGSYSWRDEAGYHTVHYLADENGYRIVKRR